MKDFKAARKANLKTRWNVENGSYNLYVDGVKVNLTLSNLVNLIFADVL